MDTKKHVDWYSTCFYNALGCSTLSLFDYLTGLIFCQIGERERSLEGDFFDEKIQVAGGATTTPHIVPSANFFENYAYTLVPQAF